MQTNVTGRERLEACKGWITYFYLVNMNVSISLAVPGDAAAIAEVISQAARDLTAKHGQGHWSAVASEKGVLSGLNKARILLARNNETVIGTLRLTTLRPWVIDPAYFTPVPRPVYLVDMAIRPDYQRIGVGRSLIEEAKKMVTALAGDAIRLDAYEGVAGAGGFYEKCGFTEMGHIVYKTVPHIYFEWLIKR
ncbi:GNAT family N-acetyltransferase [Niastella caeni]|uniref:GNAT family N-acetyltransferase n=1 Tax=Niastella caeni TaxID=2569763 RepID=A0A4S8HP46_9BACT|nr:GNAT family N-acetyltransferase [Niastella caeni]THU37073.1 GNAT family N-acetyltransferase [Niastella caeni]